MPLYDYECVKCGELFEHFYPLKDWDKKPFCPSCDGKGRKLLTVGRSMDDHPAWLNDPVLQGNLQDLDDPGNRPIYSRQAFNNYLDANGISQGAGKWV